MSHSPSDGAGTPLVNSILWLQRLQQAQQRRGYTAGEREALHAGLLKYGKDLATIRNEFFTEKAVVDVVQMYFNTDAWKRLKAAAESGTAA